MPGYKLRSKKEDANNNNITPTSSPGSVLRSSDRKMKRNSHGETEYESSSSDNDPDDFQGISIDEQNYFDDEDAPDSSILGSNGDVVGEDVTTEDLDLLRNIANNKRNVSTATTGPNSPRISRVLNQSMSEGDLSNIKGDRTRSTSSSFNQAFGVDGYRSSVRATRYKTAINGLCRNSIFLSSHDAIVPTAAVGRYLSQKNKSGQCHFEHFIADGAHGALLLSPRWIPVITARIRKYAGLKSVPSK